MGQIEAVDHHQPEPVEQRCDRKQQRVGIRGPPPKHQVETDGESQQAGAVLHQVGWELAVDRQTHVEVGHEHDGDSQQQQQQLDVASGARTKGGDDTHGAEEPQVPPAALVVWHWTACVRSSVTRRRASSMDGLVTVAVTLLR